MSTMNSVTSGSDWKAERTFARELMAVTIRSKARAAICASAKVTGFLMWAALPPLDVEFGAIEDVGLRLSSKKVVSFAQFSNALSRSR